jgi:Asp/Glu/hydantoin racemase
MCCIVSTVAPALIESGTGRVKILLINPNTTAAVTEILHAHIRRFLGASDIIVPVTARFGASYISSRAGAAIAAHAALDLLASHVDGCDVVYLGCFGDPGLSALREVSPVPVIGMAEASCHAACARGERFAIVTGGALWAPMLSELVASLGLSERFAGVRTIVPTGAEIARDPEAALADLAAACEQCKTQNGADVVILGGASLAGLAGRLQPAVSIPVLCSVEVGTRAAIGAAREPRPGLQDKPIVTSTGLDPALAVLLGLPPG